MTEPTFDRFVRFNEACTMFGVSRDALYDWVNGGLLPPPIKLGPRVAGWRQSTLENFLKEREALA